MATITHLTTKTGSRRVRRCQQISFAWKMRCRHIGFVAQRSVCMRLWRLRQRPRQFYRGFSSHSLCCLPCCCIFAFKNFLQTFQATTRFNIPTIHHIGATTVILYLQWKSYNYITKMTINTNSMLHLLHTYYQILQYAVCMLIYHFQFNKTTYFQLHIFTFSKHTA